MKMIPIRWFGACLMMLSASLAMAQQTGPLRAVAPDGTRFAPLPAPTNQPAPRPLESGEILTSPTEDVSPLDLRATSWTFVPSAAQRTYKIHDIVSIRIDETARVRAEGAAESRKNTLYDVILRDWLRLDGLGVRPSRQADGDPRVRGTTNSLYRADASVETRESLSTNIAAEIVDIRPNGTLVLEAHKMIWINENAWDTSLTGICRAQDIGPDNVILSRDILDLQVNKQERGHLKDGYRRGWFLRWFDTLQPF